MAGRRTDAASAPRAVEMAPPSAGSLPPLRRASDWPSAERRAWADRSVELARRAQPVRSVGHMPGRRAFPRRRWGGPRRAAGRCVLCDRGPRAAQCRAPARPGPDPSGESVVTMASPSPCRGQAGTSLTAVAGHGTEGDTPRRPLANAGPRVARIGRWLSAPRVSGDRCPRATVPSRNGSIMARPPARRQRGSAGQNPTARTCARMFTPRVMRLAPRRTGLRHRSPGGPPRAPGATDPTKCEAEAGPRSPAALPDRADPRAVVPAGAVHHRAVDGHARRRPCRRRLLRRLLVRARRS
jgi:hypothetical protein